VRSGRARGRGTAPLTAKTSLTFTRNLAGKNLCKGSQEGVERCPYTCALQTATRGTGASTALRIRGTLSGSGGSSCPAARLTTSAKSVAGWNAEGPAATSRYRKAPEGGRSLVESVQRARSPVAGFLGWLTFLLFVPWARTVVLVYGSIFLVLGVLGLLGLLYGSFEDHRRLRRQAHKPCPDCAETVKSEAKVCRFCGYRFADPP
jgi:hypothetical protein